MLLLAAASDGVLIGSVLRVEPTAGDSVEGWVLQKWVTLSPKIIMDQLSDQCEA